MFPSVHHLLCLSALQMYSAMNPAARSEPAENQRAETHYAVFSVCIDARCAKNLLIIKSARDDLSAAKASLTSELL